MKRGGVFDEATKPKATMMYCKFGRWESSKGWLGLSFGLILIDRTGPCLPCSGPSEGKAVATDLHTVTSRLRTEYQKPKSKVRYSRLHLGVGY